MIALSQLLRISKDRKCHEDNVIGTKEKTDEYAYQWATVQLVGKLHLDKNEWHQTTLVYRRNEDSEHTDNRQYSVFTCNGNERQRCSILFKYAVLVGILTGSGVPTRV